MQHPCISSFYIYISGRKVKGRKNASYFVLFTYSSHIRIQYVRLVRILPPSPIIVMKLALILYMQRNICILDHIQFPSPSIYTTANIFVFPQFKRRLFRNQSTKTLTLKVFSTYMRIRTVYQQIASLRSVYGGLAMGVSRDSFRLRYVFS